MGSLRKHKNGKWRAEVRKQHRYISKIFDSKGDGSKWIRETEIKIEKESFEDFRDSAHLSLANLITRYRDEITPTKKGARSEVYKLNFLIILTIIALSAYYYFKFKSYKNILLLLTGILIFYPVCFVNAPIHAIIMGVTMHYTQYLFITYKVASGRLFEINNNKTFNYSNFIIIISFYGIIMGLLSISNTFTNASFGYLIVIPLIGQLLHFYFDSLLWKFSDEHNRNVTLKFI